MKKSLIAFLLVISLLAIVPNVLAVENYGEVPIDWGGYNVYGDIRYTSVNPPSDNQITSYDTTVEHTTGEGSIQIANYTAGSENTAREANTGGIAVYPGDVVTIYAWMKGVDTSSTARIGVDFYHGSTRITAKQSDGELFYPFESDALIVANRVNSTTWTEKTINFTVPSTLTADEYSGYTNGTVHVPNYMIAWVQGEPTYGGTVYFADIQIYVTRGTLPHPTVEPAGWNPLFFLLGLAGLLFVLYNGVIKKHD